MKGRVSGMLYSIPIFAVMSDNLGERGAHRVAYQDFLSEIVFPQGQFTSCSGDSQVTKVSPATVGESTISCCFRRLGYIAAGYVAIRVVAGLVGGWDNGFSSAKTSV